MHNSFCCFLPLAFPAGCWAGCVAIFSFPFPPACRNRQPGLERLLRLGDAGLQDAWVLLEPRREEEDGHVQQAGAAEAAPVPGRAARGQQHHASEWRTKRASQLAATAAAPTSKRQHTITGHNPQQRL
jgi:hypothetical protein